jgi:hypothetical protein
MVAASATGLGAFVFAGLAFRGAGLFWASTPLAAKKAAAMNVRLSRLVGFTVFSYLRVALSLLVY